MGDLQAGQRLLREYSRDFTFLQNSFTTGLGTAFLKILNETPFPEQAGHIHETPNKPEFLFKGILHVGQLYIANIYFIPHMKSIFVIVIFPKLTYNSQSIIGNIKRKVK
ncbi:MAG: hypothetical protein JW787_10740 [Sedimentisphaerales bacterium]|nr:hypothetical protein [Sedimentisphaerales bacterium]